MNALAPSMGVVRGTVRWLLRAGVALVALVHADLLVDRLLAGELAEPGIALRWAGSAGLLAGFLVLRRRVPALRRRRAAVAFWTLVLVLHLAFLVPGGVDLERMALAPLWTAVPEAVAGAALIAALAGIAGVLRLGGAPAAHRRLSRFVPSVSGDGFVRLVPSRAPPL